MRLTVSQVNARKKAIKATLDAQEKKSDAEGRLKYALQKIKDLSTSEVEADSIDRFIYIVSALVVNERIGSLSQTRIRQLADLASALLMAMGVVAGRSTLSFLHSELHTIVSQNYRRDGQHWLSAWQQQLALQTSPKGEFGEGGFGPLTMAGRILRLGDAVAAVSLYQEARDTITNTTRREQAIFGVVKSLRLAGRLAEARSTLADIDQSQVSEGLARDLAWESLCLDVQSGGDLMPMIKACRRDGTHYQASFLLEAILWSRVQSEIRWRDKLSKYRTISRDVELGVHKQGYWAKAVRLIDQCYDTEMPFAVRLQKLGDGLGRSDELVTIDKELLFCAAATRWLFRIGAAKTCSLVALRYKSLSRSLSDGETQDLLNIL